MVNSVWRDLSPLKLSQKYCAVFSEIKTVLNMPGRRMDRGAVDYAAGMV